MSNINPYSLKEGERLPLVGGPYDGATRTVSLFLDLPESGFSMGYERYILDAANRRWVWVKDDEIKN